MKKIKIAMIIVVVSFVFVGLAIAECNYIASGTYNLDLQAKTLSFDYINSNFPEKYAIIDSSVSNVTVGETTLQFSASSIDVTFSRTSGTAEEITGVWTDEGFADWTIVLTFNADGTFTDERTYPLCYQFDDNSANLTNKWFPMSVGTTWTFSSNEDATGTISGDREETVFGVKCLRIKLFDEDHIWMAQDTGKNIHIFKGVTDDGDTFEIANDHDLPNFFLMTNPVIGDSWIVEDSNVTTYTVVSDSATIGTYNNCIKVRQKDRDAGFKGYLYFASGIGIVGIENEDDFVVKRVTNNGDTVHGNDGSDGGGGGCFLSSMI